VYTEPGPPPVNIRFAPNAVRKIANGIAYKCTLTLNQCVLVKLSDAEFNAIFGSQSGGSGSISGGGGAGGGVSETTTTKGRAGTEILRNCWFQHRQLRPLRRIRGTVFFTNDSF
jgi:hypothetical protein